MAAKPGSGQTESSAEWLENELRETKARMHKLEGELDQAQKQVWTLDADLRKVVEAAAATGSVQAALQAFREEVRQLRDQLGRVQDRQTAVTNRVEQIAGQHQAEAGREKQDLGILIKQVDALSRLIEQQDGRMKALEEVARHVEEDVAGARLSNQGVERVMEELSTRTARAYEATVRIDQEVNKYAGEFERLTRDDEAVADRLNLALEQVRRLSERMDKIELLADFPDEAREALERAAFEREQITGRLGAAEKLANELAEHTGDLLQGLARLDTRTQHHQSELLSLNARLQDTTEQLQGALKRIYQILIRQRRRQVEGLTQEIKELTQGEIHSSD
jgi:chromosome segregation ATPase